jgi:hypothetical protein
MVVGRARVALASLLLMALAVPVQAGPGSTVMDVVAPLASDDEDELVDEPYLRGIGTTVDGVLAAPGETATRLLVGDGVTPLAPNATRTRTLAIADAMVPEGGPWGEDMVTVWRGHVADGLSCLDLVAGGPGQPAGPAHHVCVASPTPLWTEGWGLTVVNPVRFAADLTQGRHVSVTLEYTYQCPFDALAYSGERDHPILGIYYPTDFGGTGYAPVLLNGPSGVALDPGSVPAVLRVQVDDGSGEPSGKLYESATTVPGLGQLVGWTLFSSTQQAGGHSDLCD